MHVPMAACPRRFFQQGCLHMNESWLMEAAVYREHIIVEFSPGYQIHILHNYEERTDVLLILLHRERTWLIPGVQINPELIDGIGFYLTGVAKYTVNPGWKNFRRSIDILLQRDPWLQLLYYNSVWRCLCHLFFRMRDYIWIRLSFQSRVFLLRRCAALSG